MMFVFVRFDEIVLLPRVDFLAPVSAARYTVSQQLRLLLSMLLANHSNSISVLYHFGQCDERFCRSSPAAHTCVQSGA